VAHAADPCVDSWLTASSGKYARIYTTDANKINGVTATTWSNGTQNQALPAYVGVQEIYSSAGWVYIRSTGLGIHTMGPWLNGAFPNLPVHTKTFWRIPRATSVPATKTLTPGGAIGYFVDGVAMFDSRDAFYWNGTTDNVWGTCYWNRDAYVNESAKFDPGYAHQPQDGSHHYHAIPVALRFELGDHEDFNSTNKLYSESGGAVAKHSPLLGWVKDGYPIYGPYGYSVATNAASGVRRMVSGYVLRNGQSGSQNLTATGRTSLPLWAQRLYNVASNILTGPAVSTTYPLSRYMEDNDYLGDLGYTQGVGFDLDEYNGRFCVTPEFPGGTYAYFVSIGSNGTPTFPYNIGRAYRGNPTGGAVTTLAETVTTNYLGGPKLSASLRPPSVSNGMVTLTWSAIEGGAYRVESFTNLTNWTTNSTGLAAVLNNGGYTDGSTEGKRFYRVAMTALASYDPVAGGSGAAGATFAVPGGAVSRAPHEHYFKHHAVRPAFPARQRPHHQCHNGLTQHHGHILCGSRHGAGQFLHSRQCHPRGANPRGDISERPAPLYVRGRIHDQPLNESLFRIIRTGGSGKIVCCPIPPSI
jgi:hypothetical protein